MARVTVAGSSGHLPEGGDALEPRCLSSTSNRSCARLFVEQKRFDDGVFRQARFDSLCAPQRESLLRYVRWLSRDKDAAQDIVQATLLRAWRSLHSLGDDRAVTAWLRTIARRELARFYSRKRLEVEDLGALCRMGEISVSQEDTMALEDLQVSLNSMTDADQQILYRSMCGYTSEEIATSTGCSLSQARMRLFRARRRLFSLMM
jgi:RNA polymerase sigma-70 factor (ECF subfamily)